MNNQTLIKGALAVAISLALSTSANAQCKLRVWEDIDKAQGIETQNLQILRRYASHEKWLAEA